jgi:hypothetical protein
MSAPKPPRHFPVRTDSQPPHWYARCGYDSTNGKEFVNPQQYKPEQVTCDGCQGKPSAISGQPVEEPK